MLKIKSMILNSSLFKSAGIYTITNIINSSIPFFLLPILTRYLSASDYGMVSMFGVLLNFMMPFTGLNIHGAIARMYYEKDKIDIRVYITNCVYILICSTFVVGIIFYIFGNYISMISSVPIQVLGVAIIISFTQFITRIVLTMWQVQVKPIQYGIYQISQTVFNMGLSIYFVVIIGMEWQGRIYAQFITYNIFAIIGIYILIKNKWLKNSFDWSYIKNALSFGIPLIPHSLGAIIMSMTDRVFITNMVGLEATGVYTVGYQIGTIISIISSSFNQAYVPWLYSKLKENKIETKIKIVKLTYIYFIVILILALGLSITSNMFLSYFIGEQFIDSKIYVIWIAVGYAFNGMYYMIGSYIMYVQKTKYLSMITFLSATFNIILNYFLIKTNGSIGAAQATTIIYLFNFLLTWKLSSKNYKMPWKLSFKF